MVFIRNFNKHHFEMAYNQLRLQALHGLFLLALAAYFSCKKPVSTVIFHTNLGKMTVAILPNLSDGADGQLKQLLAGQSDSITVSQVLQDGFVQLDFKATTASQLAEQTQSALSGAFVLCNGQFYIVQGRQQTDATLDKWEQTSGRKIPDETRAQYKKQGGALTLEGRCVVLGNLVLGKEVLDRIAALPSDGDGRPLRAVSVQLEASR